MNEISSLPDRPKASSWQWMGWSLSSWASLVFFFSLVLFTWLGLTSSELGRFPLFGSDPQLVGSYPLFWLVYVNVPLMTRDVFVTRAHGGKLGAEWWASLFLILISGVLGYRFVFGWL